MDDTFVGMKVLVFKSLSGRIASSNRALF